MTYPKTDLLALNGTSGEVEFLQIDTTSRGGPIYYLTSTWATGGTVTQGGTAYTCLPMTLSKAKLSTTDPLPQPQLSMAVTENAQLRATIAAYGDLVGCKVRRFTTFERYLDAVNYPRVNLLDWSEDLSQAAWAKGETAVTPNATTAPDGTLTADLVVDSVNSAQHYISKATNSTVFSTSVGDWLNVSCFVKYGGVRYALVYIAANSNSGTGGGPVVDLQTGTIVGINNSAWVTNQAISDVGNGWYKVSFSCYSANLAANTFRVYLTATGSTSAPAYVGTGTNGVYVWGAQVSKATTYNRFTGLNTAATTLTLNNATDPISTTTAGTVTDTTASSTHYIYLNGASGYVMGQKVSLTVYLKANTITKVMVRFLASTALPTTAYANIDLTNGTVLAQANLSAVTVQAVALSWYRVTITATTTADGAMQPAVFCLDATGNNTYLGTGSTFYLWYGSMYTGTELPAYQPTTTSHRPYADPTVTSPVETYVIAQLVDYSPSTVTWRLATPIDRPNLVLPRLQYLADDVGESATPPRCVYAPGLSRAMEI